MTRPTDNCSECSRPWAYLGHWTDDPDDDPYTARLCVEHAADLIRYGGKVTPREVVRHAR